MPDSSLPYLCGILDIVLSRFLMRHWACRLWSFVSHSAVVWLEQAARIGRMNCPKLVPECSIIQLIVIYRAVDSVQALEICTQLTAEMVEVVASLTLFCVCSSVLRSFSAQASPPPPTPPPSEKTSYGGLKDEDRIFTNLYRQGDPFIKVFSRVLCCLWPPVLSYCHQNCSQHIQKGCMSALSSVVASYRVPWLAVTGIAPRIL